MLLPTIVETSPEKVPLRAGRRLSLGVNVPINERPARGCRANGPDIPTESNLTKAPLNAKVLFDDVVFKMIRPLKKTVSTSRPDRRGSVSTRRASFTLRPEPGTSTSCRRQSIQQVSRSRRHSLCVSSQPSRRLSRSPEHLPGYARPTISSLKRIKN